MGPRAVMNALPEPALQINAKGTLIPSNEALAKRFGKRTEEHAGRDAYAPLPPELARRRRAHAEQVMRSGSAIQFDDERAGLPTISTTSSR
jgi:transcriptional regulator of aromatic amino acid metabolism